MLSYVSLMGAGLLVGAALIIIIPEGILVLISALTKKTLEKKTLNAPE